MMFGCKITTLGIGLGATALALAACDVDDDKPVDPRHASDPQPWEDGMQEDDGDDGMQEEDGGDDGMQDEGDDGMQEEDGGDDEGCNDDDHPDEDDGGDDGMNPPGGDCSPIAPFDLNQLNDVYVESEEEVIVDCHGGAGYETSTWRNQDPAQAQLWVGAVYQTRDDHAFNYHPMGAGTVSWTRPGNNVLVLGSYEPTTWDLEVSGDGELQTVIAIGYHTQVVNAPEGVEVVTHAWVDGDCYFECGYSLPGDGGGCEGEDLVALAEHLTGRILTGFDGCYDATEFSY
ncbi:MAG: hypothetical protein AAF721_30770 [Myxococcota bacterium]